MSDQAFERKALHEGHPDAIWDHLRELWMESDAVFRARIRAALANDTKEEK